MTGCRLHGPSCHIQWGYDPDHTDSPHPYTVAELEERPRPPHRYAYPSVSDYLEGFTLWRAFRRDGHLNSAEAAVRMNGLADHLDAELARSGIDAELREIVRSTFLENPA